MPKNSLPIVAIIGRPNVGKSALFNRLVGKRVAIVEGTPGVTRDRNYGDTVWQGHSFTIIDTGGFVPGSLDEIEAEVRKQAEFAIHQADMILFVVDAQTGFMNHDVEVAKMLRKQKKPVFLAVNKVDEPGNLAVTADFYKLGLGEPFPISAIHGYGVAEILDELVKKLPEMEKSEDDESITKMAIVGRPNVGKSSILNQLLGENRTIVTNQPGTTRDAIDTLMTYKDKQYLLIDTAGARRKARVSEDIEYYSVTRAMQAIRRADVAALVIDAEDGVTAQDAKLAGYIEKAGTSCILIINKWDLVEHQVDKYLEKFKKEKKWEMDEDEEEIEEKPKKKKEYHKTTEFSAKTLPHDRGAHISKAMEQYEEHIAEHLYFMTYAPIVYTCALSGQRITNILDTVDEVMMERAKRVATSELNEFLQAVVAHWQPPEKYAKAVKLLYMTQTDTNPPHFTLFVNLPKSLNEDYLRYITNSLRERFGFLGTPITINIRSKKKVK
jgi:GTPase